MKKLVTRFLVLLGCALPVVLATGTGPAGADPVAVSVGVSVGDDSIAVSVAKEAITITAGSTTLDLPIAECHYEVDCVQVQPNICFGGGPRADMGVQACTAIGN